jgi:hypothetical protein
VANKIGVNNKMQCKDYKILIVEDLYHEINKEDKDKLESHLNVCPACRKEYEELKSTMKLMKEWKDESPNETAAIFTKAITIPTKPKLKRIAWKFALAAAAVLVILSLVNFKVTYTQERLDIAFSLFGIIDKPDSQLFDSNKIAQQNPNYEVVLELIDAANRRQNAEIVAMLSDFYQAMEMKRQADLKIISQGIESIRSTTDQRLNNTDEVIHGLIKYTSALAQEGVAIKTKK